MIAPIIGWIILYFLCAVVLPAIIATIIAVVKHSDFDRWFSLWSYMCLVGLAAEVIVFLLIVAIALVSR